MAVSLLTITAGGFAGNGFQKRDTEKTMVANLKAPFTSIVVNSDIDVVLTEAADNRIEVKGDASNVNYFIKKGVLYIGSKQGSLKDKAVIYLSVSSLESIVVNGKSKISSAGFLNSSKLKVTVNAEAKFDLKNYGEILFEADEEIDLHFEKWMKLPGVAVIEPHSLESEAADESIDALVS